MPTPFLNLEFRFSSNLKLVVDWCMILENWSLLPIKISFISPLLFPFSTCLKSYFLKFLKLELQRAGKLFLYSFDLNWKLGKWLLGMFLFLCYWDRIMSSKLCLTNYFGFILSLDSLSLCPRWEWISCSVRIYLPFSFCFDIIFCLVFSKSFLVSSFLLSVTLHGLSIYSEQSLKSLLMIDSYWFWSFRNGEPIWNQKIN